MKGNYKIEIYTDGGSRGNPGNAAAAFVVKTGGSVIFKQSKFLGNATNNVAEYSAVIIALEWLLKNKLILLPATSVKFYLDSELVVKQINGDYKVKDSNLKKLHNDILNLMNSIKMPIEFENVPREKNKDADLLVNFELDKNH